MEIHKFVILRPISEYIKYKTLAEKTFGMVDWGSPNFDIVKIYINKLTQEEWEKVSQNENSIPVMIGFCEKAIDLIAGKIDIEQWQSGVAQSANFLVETNPETGINSGRTKADLIKLDTITNLNIEKYVRSYPILKNMISFSRLGCRSNYLAELIFINPNTNTPLFLLSPEEKIDRLKGLLTDIN